ncbi:MAG: YceI family protein [Reichenbachiella sp.]
MKLRIITVLILISIVLSVGYAETYSIDVKKSELQWFGKKVVGGHNGTVEILEGVFNKKGTSYSGNAVIDMNSIENVDLTDPKYKAKLEGHLKSADFFDIKKFPKSTFAITSAKQLNGDQYIFEGTLTIKGITHPIVFNGTVKENGPTTTVTAQVNIDRTKWNVVYNSKGFFDVKKLGDKLILDEINFKLSIVLSKS